MAKIKQIPYSHQSIGNDDIREVVKVLKSGWITQGPKIKEFEDALCRYTGAKYAVAVCNGTAALHLACLAAGVSEGDEVITTPVTFVASANCILYAGAKPVFADIEKNGFNIDLAQVEQKITKKTKALIPVHFSGFPYDSERLFKMARKKGVMIIEDACHALGAEYKFNDKWLKIGCCQHSDMAVFSFHPVKSIATGEGAAITTNRKDVYDKLLMLRSHGITKENLTLATQAADNDVSKPGKNKDSQAPWYYEMQLLGYNYRITDMQCALGLTQLKKIDGFMAKRRQIADFYNKKFAGASLFTVPQSLSDRKSACHLYVIRLQLNELSKTRREIFEELRGLGLGVQIHYLPVHLQPYYRNRFGFKRGDFPNAENYYDAAISIPLYPALTKQDQARVVSAVLKTIY